MGEIEKITVDDIVNSLTTNKKFRPNSHKTPKLPNYFLPIFFTNEDQPLLITRLNYQRRGVPIGFRFLPQPVSNDPRHYNLARGAVHSGVDLEYQEELDDSLFYLDLTETEYGSQFTEGVNILGIHGSEGLLPITLLTQESHHLGHRQINCYTLHYMCNKGSHKYPMAIASLEKTSRRWARNPELIETFSLPEPKIISPGKNTQEKIQAQVPETKPESIPKPKEEQKEEKPAPKKDTKINMYEPREIAEYLARFVMGQDEAIVDVATTFSSYFYKLNHENEDLDRENLLLLGPTGTGKTYMISLLSQKMGIPMVSTLATGKSSAGYKDETIDTVFSELGREVGTGRNPHAIVFLDEIDKLAVPNRSMGYSPIEETVQNNLIGWMGGTPNSTVNGVGTENIMFVGAGAFSGLEDIISSRTGESTRQIGFTYAEEEGSEQGGELITGVEARDLIKYGLRPELVGRFTTKTVLSELGVEAKVQILEKSEGSIIERKKRLMELRGFTVEINPEVYRLIAKRCPEETGARALNAITSQLFKKLFFDPKEHARNGKITISEEKARELLN